MTAAQTRSRRSLPKTVREELNQQYHWCSRQELTAGRWVNLIKLPSPQNGDEALLLCEAGSDRGHVWIPNHGEAVIGTATFAC